MQSTVHRARPPSKTLFICSCDQWLLPTRLTPEKSSFVSAGLQEESLEFTIGELQHRNSLTASNATFLLAYLQNKERDLPAIAGSFPYLISLI